MIEQFTEELEKMSGRLKEIAELVNKNNKENGAKESIIFAIAPVSHTKKGDSNEHETKIHIFAGMAGAKEDAAIVIEHVAKKLLQG